jgi:hypothetical protein
VRSGRCGAPSASRVRAPNVRPAVLVEFSKRHPSAGDSTLERGRVAERLGEREKAIESYRFVTEAWRRPDPELQPFVAEARQALGRLTAEPRR